ncbi:MAG TPA: sigma-54 dependent transcriptional regulator [Terriglobales bacterium]|nr:sigma-54 dependent transcriptional regulator [Terriglobales bacterium]
MDSNSTSDPAFAEGGVLVVSPAGLWRDQVIEELDGNEHPVAVASSGADALQKLERHEWKTLLIESELPDLDAYEVAELAIRKHPGLEVRFLRSSPQSAVDSSARSAVTSALRFPSAIPQGTRFGHSSYTHAQGEPLPGIVGSSEPMLRVYQLARRVAKRTTTVLITGATGTGKEVVARAIHQLSGRAARPFVAINCAAIPETLLESELFGYSRGAFTGAVQSQAGRVSLANGGTLFLDEVGELPLTVQAKLLRFIELKEVQRLGGAEVSKVDVRLIAATHMDLYKLVSERRFREDLFYRLAVFCLSLPRLRERADDVLPLATHFLETVSPSDAGEYPALSQSAARKLMGHNWPGNVRELQLVIERACILAEGEYEILPEHICFPGLEDMLLTSDEMRGIAV